MANPGVGPKFLSVNLSKSYGQSGRSSSSNGSYGSGRGRASGYVGGGGSGMVVLSRPRSSHKAGPKLSVPPPVNLPSLRKEHERYDPLGSGSGSAGGVGPVNGPRPMSSGMGWSKPSAVTPAERDDISSARPLSSENRDHEQKPVDGSAKEATSLYTPPSVRLGTTGPISLLGETEKATVLRGEDFPSLRATLSNTNGPSHKQKSGLRQNQKQAMIEESSSGLRDGSHSSSHIVMRPHGQSFQSSADYDVSTYGNDNRGSSASLLPEQSRKQDDYFPGPLPLVRLSPRSDWADDERDTSHGFSERSKDHGIFQTEPYWDRDFDFPRSTILPYKPAQNLVNRWTPHDDDMSKALPSEVPIADLSSRNVRTPSREGYEGNSWRSSISKDASDNQEPSHRNFIGARPMNPSLQIVKENKYVPPQFGAPVKEGYHARIAAGRDSAFGRPGVRQQQDIYVESSNRRGVERNIREQYVSVPEINRFKVDSFQSSLVSKASDSTGKGLSISDSPNFGREKRSISRREKPYVEDWGNAGFDEPDPFAGALLGVVKKKKDTTKHTDFHDPVRESFEAELERVQKLQEQERQRIIEEQEKALEVARREEEERQRIAREKEEQQRKMEEEAREAAWRAEQERFEAMRSAEEQRLAREEEKHRIFMEEERRKQAAKQKLEELEKRMARRQAEAANADGTVSVDENIGGVPRERDASGTDDLVCWKGSERMVEGIQNSSSSDSSSLSRLYDVGLRTHTLRDGSYAFTDRGKPSSWRREIFENGNSSAFFPSEQENSHQSPRRDAFASGRTFPHNDLYGGNGQVGSRGYRGGFPEPQVDEFSHAKARKWNISADGDPYSRNTEFNSEFHDTIADRFSEMGWDQGHIRGNLHAPYTDQVYQTSEVDELYSYGRPRYSSRQPRVLPPPSLASVHKKSLRSDSEHVGPSLHEDSKVQYTHTSRGELAASSYHNDQMDMQGHHDVLDAQEDSYKTELLNLNRDSALRCDSQSSLSVSSPPHSPVHLSHDDLDDTVDSPVASAPTESNEICLSGNDTAVLNIETVKENMMTTSSSISTGEGDWGVDNNEELPEQEEYEDNDDGFHEEDEMHEREDGNVVLAEQFEGMHLDAAGPSHEMDNVVLGFDQGVQVCIPSDECERGPREKEGSYTVPQVSANTFEQSCTLKGRQGDGLSIQFGDGSSDIVVNSPSRNVHETISTLQDFASHPFSAAHTSTSSDLLNSTDDSSGSALSAHQSGHCADMNSFSSGPAVVSSKAYLQNQADMPVKLQFGLFSGPSLIPSPIPAIQIGSIQMPLQLHPQVGASITHMHPPQPPLFHLGQLRYPSPVSLGLLPMTQQSVTFSQPSVPTNYPLNQKTGVPISGQLPQDGPAHSFLKGDVLSLPRDNQHSDAPVSGTPKVIMCEEVNVVKEQEGAESDVALLHQIRAEESNPCENQPRVQLSRQTESDGSQHNSARNSALTSIFGTSEGQVSSGSSSAHGFSSAKCVSGSTSHAQSQQDSRGRKLAFAPTNPSQKLPFTSADSSCSDANGFPRRPRRGFQRMEFRVRQSADRRQSSVSLSINHPGTDLKSNNNRKGPRTSARSGFKREPLLGRPRQMAELGDFSSDQVEILGTNHEITADERQKNDDAVDASHLGEGRQKRNISSGEDVDAPLQSGIVRVFNQPGIEAPSDEDDFIEVRSKRQMLNDRREQREREIKAKSNSKKALRKLRPASQGAAVARTSVRVATSSGLEASNGTESDITRTRGLLNDKVAPIGTPINAEAPADVKSHNNKSVQTNSTAAVSSAGQTVGPGFIFESKKQTLDNAKSSLGSWGTARIIQEVMPLTQSQFDEAMKSTCLGTHSSSTAHHATSVSKPSISSSSILLKGTPFSSPNSPINSLLTGEKIQFGAVTSPTVILPRSRAVSHGIGPPGSQSNISQNVTGAEGSHSLLFEKEKHSEKSCIHLEAAEAEAEAAASAVAVAAISNDDGVGNGLDGRPGSMPEVSGTGDHQLTSESKGEETLIVSLPADLSVETPPISLWPPLPSPHTSSGQMLSPFPGGTRNNFPLYDMNPVLGGPVFAFGPQEESAGSQSQPQKNSTSASGPPGSWQRCPSGVDSFYGPPTAFTGPFINPPGGIPGVQGPPHMVVYNHFAPIGHFGQVGLSYMGTYISSTKQPDWKHNPATAGGVTEGDVKNFNMASAPHNTANVQNLAPGSPLLPMPPPLAMFDVSPFQSGDIPVQGRWPHVPAPSIQSIPQSMPLSQQSEGTLPSQLNHGPVDNHSFAIGRFSKPQSPSPPQSGNASAAAATDATVTHFVDKLGLVDPHGSEASIRAASNDSLGNKSTVSASGKADSNKSNMQGTSSGSKLQASHQKNSSGQHQYNHPPSYNYQRAGTGESQKNGSAAEWSHRRTGFHRRNHSSAVGERVLPPTKMKQIYVAKQSSGGASSAV